MRLARIAKKMMAGLALLGPALAALILCTWIPKPVGNGAARGAAVAAPVPTTINFNRDIRPLLSDRCFSCHGPDANKRQAGLRLDRPEGATGPLPQHPKLRAFVPGKPEQSEAIRRITSDDPKVVMPPATSHLKLDAREKDLIRQWVAQGGEYQEHWAFIAPKRREAPAVADAAWPKNDIDRFVLARLEREGLHPSPEADRATLIRRVSLDLTGIPPTPSEVEAFVSDMSANAYEKVVDRLLASPHYGEQMATQWLDYARYADSHGYQSDPERHMWRWRDWVINAYNANMPFDRFTIEQLAGDLLPDATTDQKIATGFNRNHRINDEGGVIAEEWRVEGVVDRASTTSAVWLGLTMECCRCHDHKFDPVTQKEFYRFSAFFNSVNEQGVGDTAATDKGINVPPVLKLPTDAQAAKQQELNAAIIALTSKIDGLKKQLPERQAAWEKAGAPIDDPAGLAIALPLDGTTDARDGSGAAVAVALAGKDVPAFVEGPHGKAIRFEGKGNAIDLGKSLAKFERTDAFSYGAWVRLRGGGAVLSRMEDAPGFRGYDLFIDGDRLAVHVIHQWPDHALKVVARKAFARDAWMHVMVTYDGSGKAAGIKLYVDGKPQETTPAADTLDGTIVADAPLLVGKRVNSSPLVGEVADVRVYGRALAPAEAAVVATRPAIDAVLKVAPDKRSAAQKKDLASFYASIDKDLVPAVTKLAEEKAALAALDREVPDTMVMEELPKPRDTFVLIRGEYDKHGERVEPGVPAVLPPMPKGAPMNRLGLAEWIVDPANPLTARVQANRLWEKFFGVGLVKTSENLGTQTEWPSHPELLDWLATEMLRLHWDLKAFQREIVLSAAYRQSSAVTADLIERDPENRLIARGPRFRLNAEAVRDQALAVAGLLAEQVGGPSVKPYEPANVWDGNLFGNLSKYTQDSGPGLYRRSLYTFVKRTATPPNLTIFDMPSREYCVIRRSRTDTPLQALDLLNDPTYVEAARVLAERMMTGGGGAAPTDRIAYGFKRATCRPPTAEESKILLAGYGRQLARFRQNAEAAAKLIAVGDSKPDPKLDVPELAAYTMTARVILNLDEMVTRQ